MQAYDSRRYLTTFDTHRVPHILTDVLVIGSGIAGRRAAIEAAAGSEVILVTKDRIAESNTAYAQGGIAISLAGLEDGADHVPDTLPVGCGISDRRAVDRILPATAACPRDVTGYGASIALQDCQPPSAQ